MVVVRDREAAMDHEGRGDKVAPALPTTLCSLLHYCLQVVLAPLFSIIVFHIWTIVAKQTSAAQIEVHKLSHGLPLAIQSML
jgi:hypothetical protein